MREAVAATGLEFVELTSDRAAELGCLSAVQRLQRGGRLSRNEHLCQAAARSGQLEKLKEFRANRCPWNVLTCAGAAYGGHLEVLQWARANGAPWDTNTCREAAEGGHLEVLQWARANGCPWDEKGLNIAAEFGHEAMVQALIEAAADINKATNEGSMPLYVAAYRGYEAVVRAQGMTARRRCTSPLERVTRR